MDSSPVSYTNLRSHLSNFAKSTITIFIWMWGILAQCPNSNQSLIVVDMIIVKL